MKTTADRVVLIRDLTKDKTESGILIPGEAARPANRGTVKYVGEECKTVKEGDTVLFSVAGTEYDHKGETLTIIREINIDLIL